MFPMRACVVGGERTGGRPGAPNCNLQPDFHTGPAPAGNWKSGKSVIKEGMEKQGLLVLYICLATHPFEISTLPFLVSLLSQTFIILFLEIMCMCVWVYAYEYKRPQRLWDPSQSESKGDVRHPLWVLGTELRSVYRVYSIQYSEQCTLWMAESPLQPLTFSYAISSRDQTILQNISFLMVFELKHGLYGISRWNAGHLLRLNRCTSDRRQHQEDIYTMKLSTVNGSWWANSGNLEFMAFPAHTV